MKVDLEESRGNVAKRLEFIEAEIKKLDDQIADKQSKQTVIGEEVTHLYYCLLSHSDKVWVSRSRKRNRQ